MDLNIKVNVLPTLTYNFLHVNGGEIDEKDINITDKKTPDFKSVSGVEVSEMSFADADKTFDAYNTKEARNKGIITIPNGDTTARNDGQALRTGMGIEVDELMKAAQVPCTVITALENTKAVEPIYIKYEMQDGAGSLSSQVIHAQKNSEITVIMDYSSDAKAKGFHGVSTRILAEEGSTVHLIKTQLLGSEYLHFDDIGGLTDTNARIEITSMELGSSKVWNGCYTELFGKESTFADNTGYLCREHQTLDMNYVADQRGKKTDSQMMFRGVLMDQASKVFRGTIDFKNGSSGSIGNEQEEALLLSPDVINRTMPIILCQEEDVDGRHGASIGQLGEDLLFYMQSRGIEEEEAKKMIIRARMDSITRTIPDEELVKKVQDYTDAVLN